MTKLPRLYKTTKTSAIQICDISYASDRFFVSWGQLDGAMQDKFTICKPTNEGRANHRDATAQAEFEALAKHKSKIKSGYQLTADAAPSVQLPQKVKKWTDLMLTPKRAKALILPCTVEYKLNGVNGIYRLANDTLTLWSRGGESFEVPPHHKSTIAILMTDFQLTELNVELYIPNYYLQDIQAAVTKHNDGTKLLVAMIFEFPANTATYIDKLPLKHKIAGYCKAKSICNTVDVIIPAIAETIADIDIAYERAIALDLEGVVITNYKSTYQYNTRSSNVWKRKPTLDAEFLITGYVIDKNNLPVFKLSSIGGEFKASPKGTHEFLASIDPATYVGQWYTVEYETLSKTGVPLKPVGVGLRGCNSSGNPKV